MLMEPGKKSKVLKIRNQFNSPEEIDDNPNTSPSKRILGIFPGYQKVFDGPLIVGKIGLQKIRDECVHFNDWVTKLETL